MLTSDFREQEGFFPKEGNLPWLLQSWEADLHLLLGILLKEPSQLLQAPGTMVLFGQWLERL